MPSRTQQPGLVVRELGPMAAAVTAFFQRPPDQIRGIDAGEWFGPLQPIRPLAPEGTEPRIWQYQPGQNLVFTPRPNQQYNAETLQGLARYPLARICIENVKDMVSRMPILVRAKRLVGETERQHQDRQKKDDRLKQLQEIIDYPNREQNRSEFTRKLLEDMLVIDAASVLIRQQKGGRLMDLYPVAGETITRYITETGTTPTPEEGPAYAQLWFGAPMVNLTTQQLLYCARNILPNQLYGYSPTEQISEELKIGIERLAFVYQYYVGGDIPDAMQIIPKGVTPDKIVEAQQWMVSDLAGMMAKRRQMRLIQGFTEEGTDQIIFPKEKLLSDPFDDLHIRKVCFAYGTSPQRLLRMLNRATGQSNQEAAEEEGTMPWVDWLTGVYNKLIQQRLALPDYEVTINTATEPNPDTQSQTLDRLVAGALMRINEGREILGLDPDPSPEASQLGVRTGAGFVPLGETAATPPGQEAAPGKESNGPAGSPKKAGAATKRRPAGHHAPRLDPAVLEPRAVQAQHALQRIVHDSLMVQRQIAQGAARRLLVDRLPGGAEKLLKSSDNPTPRQLADTIWAAVAAELERLPSATEPELAEAAVAGAHRGLAQFHISDQELVRAVNETARDWARQRAAEMIGMRRTPEGELVPNPSARWRISDTTREDIRGLVVRAFEQETPLSDLIAQIDSAGAFSEGRAETIARTEVAFAQTTGNYEAWDATGVVLKVKWLLSEDHDVPDECLVAETSIEAASIERGISRSYTGPIITLHLPGGKKLSGTPNHPVLTNRGWKPLQEIHDGDHLVSGDWMKSVASIANYFDDVKASIQDIVCSLPGRTSPVPTAARDFHGDGIGSHVHAVTANGLLDRERPRSFYQSMKTPFHRGIKLPPFLSGQWDALMSRAHAIHSLGWCPAFSGFKLGVAATPQLIASPPEPGGDRGGGNVVPGRDLNARQLLGKIKSGEILCGGMAKLLSLTPVLSRTMNVQSAHVFNLTTKAGFFLAGNIITSNCDDNDGETVEFGKPFPSGDFMPPLHPNCVLPGTLVTACGEIGAHMTRPYEGDSITITVEGGVNLAVTPNHPILTRYGLMPAGLLSKGDDVFLSDHPRAAAQLIDPHHDNVPSMIEQIFHSLLVAGGVPSRGVPVTTEDFHGDGMPNSQVDIVWAASLLERQRKLIQDPGELAFIERDPRRAALFFGGRASAEFGQSDLTSTDRSMGGRGGSLAALRSHADIAQQIGLVVTPEQQPMTLEELADRSRVDADGFAQLNAALPGLITPVKITNILRGEFVGHVHNLRTGTGFYFANGILTHNCWCVLVAAEIEG